MQKDTEKLMYDTHSVSGSTTTFGLCALRRKETLKTRWNLYSLYIPSFDLIKFITVEYSSFILSPFLISYWHPLKPSQVKVTGTWDLNSKFCLEFTILLQSEFFSQSLFLCLLQSEFFSQSLFLFRLYL